MFNQIDDELNLASLLFTFTHNSELVRLPAKTYNIVVGFMSPANDIPSTEPFRFDADVHQAFLDQFYMQLDEFDRVTTPTASLFIYAIPQWLPYLSVYLSDKGWGFKYWFAMKTHALNTDEPMKKAHSGLVLLVKNRKKFHLRKVRSPHKVCEICGDYLADWGGKKHLRHPYGYAISDVWDDLPSVEDEQFVFSKYVWQRIILMCANDNHKILCVDYEGDRNLVQYMAE